MTELTYRSLAEIFLENVSVERQEFLDKVSDKLNVKPQDIHEMLNLNIYSFLGQLRKKYHSVSRSTTNFYRKYKDWLQTKIIVADRTDLDTGNKENIVPSEVVPNCKKRGRPSSTLDYNELDARSRRRKKSKVSEELQSHGVPLADLLIYNLRKESDKKKAELIQAINDDRTGALTDRLYSVINLPEVEEQKFSSVEALAITIDLGLTKRNYEALNSYLRHKNINVLPPYISIAEEKKKCTPLNFTVTKSSVDCSLQEVVDHTARRIMESKTKAELQSLADKEILVLYSKCGFDGSNGQFELKSKKLVEKERKNEETETELPDVSTNIENLTTEVIPNEDSDTQLRTLSSDPDDFDVKSATQKKESQLFTTSLAPLKITRSKNNDEVWKNLHPNSVKFCRPFRFTHVKEDKVVIQAETSKLKGEIKNLNNTIIQIHGKELEIEHRIYFSMLDGKCVQHATNTTATQRCTICGLTSAEFNSEDYDQNNHEEKHGEHGISPLHARIRLMEFIKDLACDKVMEPHPKPISETGGNKKKRKSKAEKDQERKQRKERKKINAKKREVERQRIVTDFREKIGIVLDQPKQNFGNSNDGNTSRRFFENPKQTADILQINEELVIRFANILNLINSQFYLDADAFELYAKDTVKLLRENYPFKKLTPTVHKVLVHGAYIIRKNVMPLGTLSEEAQEAIHKIIRKYRQQNTCKISLERLNEDLFRILMVSTDPLISSFRRETSRKDREWPKEIKHIIQQ